MEAERKEDDDIEDTPKGSIADPESKSVIDETFGKVAVVLDQDLDVCIDCDQMKSEKKKAAAAGMWTEGICNMEEWLKEQMGTWDREQLPGLVYGKTHFRRRVRPRNLSLWEIMMMQHNC